MRFTKKKELIDAYLNDDAKVVVKFLWLPLTIKGETRWLEKAEVKYKVDWEHVFLSRERDYFWKAVQFLND